VQRAAVRAIAARMRGRISNTKKRGNEESSDESDYEETNKDHGDDTPPPPVMRIYRLSFVRCCC
jgi:hypothetical protein